MHTKHQAPSTKPIDAVLILRDPTSKDGWIAKRASGKVCFIYQIASIASRLEPGQLWSYEDISIRDRYDVVKLEALSPA